MSVPPATNHAESPFSIAISRIFQLEKPNNVDDQAYLTLAILRNDLFAVERHLTDDVDIGRIALQLAFSLKTTNPDTIKKILLIMQNRHPDIDELTENLFQLNCKLYHASFLRDIRVIEGLLHRGVRQIDWAGDRNMTALLVAASTNQLELLILLANFGANLKAVDWQGRGALHFAAFNANRKMVQFLLDRGADPNARTVNYFDGLTPLGASMQKECMESNKCAELLLLHGAVPSQRIGERQNWKLLDEANYYKSNLLIGYAALRELQGDNAIAESIMQSDCESRIPEYREKYEKCKRILGVEVFEELTLMELVSASKVKFQMYMRRESLYDKVTEFVMMNHRSGVGVYYNRVLDYRMEKAMPRFLEDKAILDISRLFGGSFDQCYVFGRRVVEYLSRRDAYRLGHV